MTGPRVAAACSASHGKASDWEPAAVETRAAPISLCRKRSFATYRNPHSVWLARAAGSLPLVYHEQ